MGQFPDSSTAIPIYKQIENELHNILEQGEFSPHSRFLSEVELSKRYDVNPVTARKAVNRLVEQGRLYKVHRSGTFVSPPPRNRLVILVTTLSQESIIGSLTPVVSKYPDLQWQEVYIGDLRPQLSDIKHVYPKLIGVLFVRDLPSVIDVIEGLQKQEIPVCFCGSDVHAAHLQKTHSVLCCEADLVDLALQHLLDSGCRRIGMVGSTEWAAFQSREASLREWCVLKGIPVKEPNMIDLTMKEFSDPWLSFEKIRDHLMGSDFDADGIFCANDAVATSLVQAALSVGIKIPEQLKVVTTDDNDRLTVRTIPQVSSVRIPFIQDIQEGLNLLSDKALPKSVYEKRWSRTYLIPRQSTTSLIV